MFLQSGIWLGGQRNRTPIVGTPHPSLAGGWCGSQLKDVVRGGGQFFVITVTDFFCSPRNANQLKLLERAPYDK